MKYLNLIFKTIKEQSPILYWVVIIHLLFVLICLGGLIVDERTLMGVNVWIKPLKFSISGAIYIGSVGFLVSLYPYSRLKKSILCNTTAITLIAELFIIVMQGARGVKSHYNVNNYFDGILFGTMGILIAINVVIMIVFIIDTTRLKLNTGKTIQWSILMGWIIILIGSWIGGQMISQMSHNVGIADGGTGLPLVNWSTIAGDLRVAHFFGLHGLQIIPLFAFIISKKWKTTDLKQILLVSLFGIFYAAWIGFTFYQAKQGLPLIHM